MVMKVDNVSKYWKEMDYDTPSYILKWATEESKNYLIKNKLRFLNKYCQISVKYGILLPNFETFENLQVSISDAISNDFSQYDDRWIPLSFNWLYVQGEKLLLSCDLYIQQNNNINLERIVNADLLLTYQHVKENNNVNYAQPITINFFQDYLYITFNSDAFFGD